MTIGMNLRKALSGTTLALAMAAAVILVPVGAQADNGGMPAGKSVCNTASHNGTGGNLSVDALDPQTAIRNSTDLRAKSGGRSGWNGRAAGGWTWRGFWFARSRRRPGA